MRWMLPVVVLMMSISASGQTTRPTTQPSPSDMADKLLARMVPAAPATAAADTQAPVLDLTSGAGAVAPGAPSVPLVREGTHLFNVTGRLSHNSDGQQAVFTFDVDAKTMLNPPMILLPNLKLVSMESAVSSTSKDVHFRISGTVTEYKGRNYILLDKAVVVSDVDQKM